jgi:hypothetical protein
MDVPVKRVRYLWVDAIAVNVKSAVESMRLDVDMTRNKDESLVNLLAYCVQCPLDRCGASIDHTRKDRQLAVG